MQDQGQEAARKTAADDNRATLPMDPRERRRAFLVLTIGLMCTGFSQSVVYAILPPIARDLGLSELQVGSIFVLSSLFWVLTTPWWGRRSDRLGRKVSVLIGLFGFSLSMLLFTLTLEAAQAKLLPLAVAFPLLIVTRSLYGLIVSAAGPSSQAYVADRTSRDERTRATATIGAAYGLGATIGPGVSASLVILGILVPFYFTVLLGLLSALLIWAYLPERERPVPTARKVKLGLFDRRITLNLVNGGLISSAQAIMIQTVAFYMMDRLSLPLDHAAQYAGIGLMAASLAALFGQLVIVHRFRMTAPTLERTGLGITAVAFLALGLAHQIGPLVFALTMVGLGQGLARPGNAAVGSLVVRRHEQGAVAGLSNATNAFGFLIMPFIAMPAYRLDPALPYFIGTGLLALAIVLSIVDPNARRAGERGADGYDVDDTDDPMQTL
ncbi:MFS transporter [Zavarzinia compransoris]|uniref:MFS transporter n=1 Tax=Zavarzinia compransoris TaxID=1264899 RepID=A0A317E833_9PROT|nr:MFS transporter [Zavarzinia compransoris]PWR23099.1 MFS transporter [Zavarzinia compransoris]TDP46351.1 putative MFS family arabinose efflux permease [Zavarzinia compransoris]